MKLSPVVLLLLFCVLVFGDHLADHETSEIDSLDSDDASESPAVAPEPEPTCMPELGYLRNGGTYNIPNETLTETAVECCLLCRSDDRCLTWTRRRTTGACFLMEIIPPLELNDDFDSGFLRGTEAAVKVLKPDCLMETGVSYPKGVVLVRLQTKDAEMCCRTCEGERRCFSWYYNRRSKRCVLNGNVPAVKTKKGYTGAALI